MAGFQQPHVLNYIKEKKESREFVYPHLVKKGYIQMTYETIIERFLFIEAEKERLFTLAWAEKCKKTHFKSEAEEDFAWNYEFEIIENYVSNELVSLHP